jgi:outer membrane lipoprotein SlyB
MTAAARRIHPLVAVASVAVILFSGVGIGVATGLIPNTLSKSAGETATLLPPPTAVPGGPVGAETPVAALPGATADAVASKPFTRTAAKSGPSKPLCANCGVVDAVTKVEQAGEGTGLGAVAGGVAGGLLGNQVGKGTGKKIATVAGAAGGAYVGHQVEKEVRKSVRYDVRVKMDDGSYRLHSQSEAPAFGAGDRVRIVDGALVAG